MAHKILSRICLGNAARKSRHTCKIMITIQNYLRAESPEQAYALNQMKNNLILGGMMWSRLGKRSIHTAIDLSGLGLDKIEEKDDKFIIGAMVSLRDLEKNDKLDEQLCTLFQTSFQHIVGVQFRNMATVGGSVFGRFGFSDVISTLLALDSSVELYGKGMIPLSEFVKQKRERDLLLHIHIPKKKRQIVYYTHRNSATDLPVLTVLVSRTQNKWNFVIGARPGVARLLSLELMSQPSDQELHLLAENIASQFTYETNLRGSKEYRKHLASVFIKRGIQCGLK